MDKRQTAVVIIFAFYALLGVLVFRYVALRTYTCPDPSFMYAQGDPCRYEYGRGMEVAP